MFTSSIAVLGSLCAVATCLLGYFGKPICNRLGLMDVPDVRKQHKNATPLLGGLTLTCIILPLSTLAIFIEVDQLHQQSTLLYVIATFAMTLIGMADDRHSLSARDRILLSVLVFGSIATVDPLFNVRVLDFSAPHFQLGLLLAPVAVAFTALCCVGLVNAINMADGKNGLVIGLCLAWLTIMSLRAPGSLTPMILIAISGLVVLFIFNIRGELFLGDGGSYGFATAVGLLVIAIYNSTDKSGNRLIFAENIVLLFIVPVADSFRLTFVRLSRGQSPMSADRDHLHHHLQDKFGWPAGLIVYLILAFLPISVYLF